MPRQKIRRSTKIIIGVIVLLFVLALLQIPIGRITGKTISISEQTTRIVEPLRSDGGIDYIGHLNELLSEGTTPEKNAFVKLIEYLKYEAGYGSQELDLLATRLETNLTPAKTEFQNIWDHVASQYTMPVSGPIEDQIADEYGEVSRRPWKRNEFPKWADAIDSHADLFDGIQAALQLPEFYSPIIGSVDGYSETLSFLSNPYMDQLRSVVGGFGGRAMMRLGHNDAARAVEDAKAIRRLATCSGQTASIYELYTQAYGASRAIQVEQQLFSHGELNIQQLNEYRDFILSLPETRTLHWQIDKYERYSILDVIQQLALYGDDDQFSIDAIAEYFCTTELRKNLIRKSAHLVDWNAAMIVANQRLDELSAASNEPNDRIRLQKLIGLQDELELLSERLESPTNILFSTVGGPRSRGRWYGNAITYLMLPDVASPASVNIRTKIWRDLVLVAIDLERFRLDHGQYPEQLQSLVPDYSSKIPFDRFTDGPLAYRTTPSGYVLYSLGINEVDDGGVDINSEHVVKWPDYDIVFEVDRSKRIE